MFDVTFRTFGKEDCGEALDFLSGLPGIRLHTNGEDTVEGITAYLERNPGLSFVAVCDDRIVGTILCGHDGRRGYIHHLAVDDRFKEKGIGRRLVQLATAQLKACNIRKSAVFVLKENDIGEAFYKSLRWKEENSVKIYAKTI
jgi:ribosomal protein S18 acetylase RimI-like enzyme